jgi:hypothetical protein
MNKVSLWGFDTCTFPGHSSHKEAGSGFVPACSDAFDKSSGDVWAREGHAFSWAVSPDMISLRAHPPSP